MFQETEPLKDFPCFQKWNFFIFQETELFYILEKVYSEP